MKAFMMMAFFGVLIWSGSDSWDSLGKVGISLERDSVPLGKDSLEVVRGNVEFLYQMLVEEAAERQAEDLGTDAFGAETSTDETDRNESDIEASFEELLQEYLFLQENPININSEEVTRLEEIGLLNTFQIEGLRHYQRQYGNLLLINELTMIEEFNEHTIAVLAPVICFGKNEWEKEHEKISAKKMVTQGKHQLTVNFAQKTKANSDTEAYLGSPIKLQVKYIYHFQKRFRMGFVMEKDAGEPFFLNRLNDSLQDLVGQLRKPGFDFYGFHLYASDLLLTRKKAPPYTKNLLTIKDLALGDYLLSFGQGLTLWSGMGLGKAANGSMVMKRAAGIKPKAAASEGKFFRGAASTLRYNDFYATAFYSIRDIDATTSLLDSLDEPEAVSSLLENGYHRSLNELKKRNVIQQQVFGGHLSYSTPQLDIGVTAYHLRLSAPLQLKPSKYNQYYFQGDQLTNVGLDFRWTSRKTAFFGEVARSNNGAFAGLVGITMKPAGYINFSILYRNYDKRYQNLLNNAFGESSRRQGEEGYYLGIECAPAPQWTLLAYCDFFRFSWLASQVYNPSWGQEYHLKIEHQINRKASMQLRFKSKTKMRNSPDNETFSYYPVFYTKRNVHFQVSYAITDDLVFTDRAEYSHYLIKDESDSRGYLLCHDVAYKPEGKPYAFNFRYALFRSDDYNSRLTVYENDVLGAFSIPSFYGLGSRIYLLGRVKLFNLLSIYSRFSCTFSSDGPLTGFNIEIVFNIEKARN